MYYSMCKNHISKAQSKFYNVRLSVVFNLCLALFTGVSRESFAGVPLFPPLVWSLCSTTRHGRHFCEPCTACYTQRRQPSSRKSFWWMTPAQQVGTALSAASVKINYKSIRSEPCPLPVECYESSLALRAGEHLLNVIDKFSGVSQRYTNKIRLTFEQPFDNVVEWEAQRSGSVMSLIR